MHRKTQQKQNTQRSHQNIKRLDLLVFPTSIEMPAIINVTWGDKNNIGCVAASCTWKSWLLKITFASLS